MSISRDNIQACVTPEVCYRRFDELERRMTILESDTWRDNMWGKINDIAKDVANLNGRITGYLLAGGVLGAVLATLAQLVLKGN